MGPLSQVSIVVAAALALIYFLVLLAPKIRDLFPRSAASKEKEQARTRSDHPDACAPCRQEVHDIGLALVEHRRETIASTDRMVQSTDNLRETMGELRDFLRDFLVEQRTVDKLRQTGDGIHVPRSGRGGGKE